jgi:osmoprotectant transport system permease protein
MLHFLSQLAGWFANGDHWQGTGGIPHRVIEHLSMSGAAILAALILALPISLALGHSGKAGFLAINISNIGRAVPSFAILVLGEQVLGIGAKPAFVALVALAIPPIVTNTYTAIRQVDPDLRDAARGMGMTGGQILRRVEWPVAIPLIFAGIRTAGVQVVATATLAAVIAWGGLGRYIIDGIAQRDHIQVFAGALLVVVLSLFTEVGLGALQRAVTPAGLRKPSLRPAAAEHKEIVVVAA